MTLRLIYLMFSKLVAWLVLRPDLMPVGAENRVVSSDQRLLGHSWSRSASRAA
jgi:hypothetical protein